jgi:hypothetical protein
MKTMFIILVLILTATASIGQELDETSLKKDIAEVVFRYEFEHFEREGRLPDFVPSSYAIYSNTGFNINEPYLARFRGTVLPVTKYKEPTSCEFTCKVNSIGKFTCPLNIIITGLTLNGPDSAQVATRIAYTVDGKIWYSRYTVVRVAGKWIVTNTKRKASAADC